MEISLALAAVLAGALTVLAPCIFGALPILLGRGVDGFGRARRIIVGLLVSIFLFTLLLKATTLLLGVPLSFWQALSGAIIGLVGLSMVWPQIYARLALQIGLEQAAVKGQQAANNFNGSFGDYVLGASLGPVFSACSPTYALIVAVILPNNPLEGMLYLLWFLAGLGALLALIAIGGQKLVAKLNWSLNPEGRFKRSVGLLLVLLGGMIVLGLDRDLLAWLVDKGYYDWQVRFEDSLR